MALDATSRLTPYVPRLLVDWLKQTPDARHRAIEGTLIHLDISGFTRMSERLARQGKEGAEELTELLNLHFGNLLRAARAYDGDLLRFGGDALLLLFADEDHAARACNAALLMRQRLRETGTVTTSAGRATLRMTVGVNSGTVHCFLVGDTHRELVVAGPVATATVRFESEADPMQILVGPSTAAAVDPRMLAAAKGDGRLLKRTMSPTPAPSQATPALPGSVAGIRSLIPVALREHLAEGSGEGEHRQVTVGFVKFSGTDAPLASGRSDDVTEMLDRLISSTQSVAEELGICFLPTDIDEDGGKIILAAGAPQTAGDDEERMLRALRAIDDRGHDLPLKLGAARGHVFAGDVGADFRRVYTVMGDTVNLAARLMAHSQPGQVLVTPEVVERSRAPFDIEAIAPFHAKGKSRPVAAFSVGAPVLERSDVPADEHRLPLIGRDSELATMLSALEATHEGRGRALELAGEAGMGKSRLVEEFEERAGRATFFAAACGPYASTTPYFPFRSLLAALLEISLDGDPVETGDQLASRVTAEAPQLIPWLPLLAIPLNATVRPTRESDQLDPGFRRARLNQAVLDLLRQRLRGPTVLLIEDTHWIDEASSDLLRFLAEHVKAQPWLIIATRRPEGPAPFGDDAATISLQPLAPEAAAELATAGSAQSRLPPHLIARLAERAGGNPLYLLELAGTTGAATNLDELPETVEALIAARIDRLRPQDRDLLRASAVVGQQSFDVGLLSDVVGGDIPDLSSAAVWTRLSEFLERTGDRQLRFRHALVRDAAYEALPYRRRRELHGRVGEVIEREAAGRFDGVAELLSLHFHNAQQRDKAWRYSVLAGGRAREKFANVEAAVLYRRAIDAGQHIDVPADELGSVSEALGDVSELSGLYDEASDAYRGARRHMRDDGTAETRLLRKEGELRERVGKYSQALRWYGRALRRIEEAGLGREGIINGVEICLAYAGVRLRQGRYRDCVRWCERAIDDALPLDYKSGLGHAYLLLDAAYTNLGDDRRDQYRELALPIFEELEDLVMTSRVLNNLGYDAAYIGGNWVEGLAYYERSKEAKERVGDVRGAATVNNNIAEILSDQGLLDEAESLLTTALRTWRAAGFSIGIALATSNLGRAAARDGRAEEADRLLGDAAALLREIDASESYVLETDARIAESRVIAGDWENALRVATDALERAQGRDVFPGAQAMLKRVMGYALLQANRVGEARSNFAASLEHGRSAGLDYEQALTLEALGRVARSEGEAAAKYETASADIFARLGVARRTEIPGFRPAGAR